MSNFNRVVRRLYIVLRTDVSLELGRMPPMGDTADAVEVEAQTTPLSVHRALARGLARPRLGQLNGRADQRSPTQSRTRKFVDAFALFSG